MKFKIEGTTADKRLIAFGKSRAELFQNAALGMFSEMVDMEKIVESEIKIIEIQGAEDFESLLVHWLNEILFYFDREGFVGRRFTLEALEKDALKAVAHGSRVSAESVIGEIKAATYHEVEILEGKGSFQARVILDV